MNDNGPQNTKRHETFYFPYGDLVIQSAADSGGMATLYRVSKSVLAFNSPVFAGMFTLPDAAIQERYDGAPIVCLMDTAEELDNLFAALHEPSFFSYQRHDPHLPLRFTPVMRIAKKYEIERICARVVEVIVDSWPQSFEQWIRADADLTIILDTHNKAEDGIVDGKRYEERVPEPAAAVRFAQDFDVPSVLPMAMYALAGILDSNEWGASNGRIIRAARWNLLSATDLRRFLRFKTGLTHCVFAVYDRFSSGEIGFSPDACESRRSCKRGFDIIVSSWTHEPNGLLRKEMLGTHVTVPDPLGLLQNLYITIVEGPLCTLCVGELQGKIRDVQEAIFNLIIPQFN